MIDLQPVLHGPTLTLRQGFRQRLESKGARANWRSRKAIEKIGGVLACEADRQVGDKMVPYTYYRITKPA